MKKILTVLTALLLLSVIGTTNVLADGELCYVDVDRDGDFTEGVDEKYNTIKAALKHGETVTTIKDPRTGESDTVSTIIVLIGDITENVTIPAERNITLDLHGYALTCKATSTVSIITNKGTLEITDSNPESTHNFKVDSNGLWTLDDNPATEPVEFENLTGIPAADTVVKVKGGCITGGVGSDKDDLRKGGCIYNVGNLTISAGNIVGNKADKGGAIYTNTSSSFSMKGGNIIGNTSKYGGGVYSTKGLVSVSGGNIAYNKTTSNGAAIYIGTAESTAAYLNFSDNAKLFRNTGKNGCVYINTTKEINFSGGTIEENIGGVHISNVSNNTATIKFSGNIKIQNNTKSDLPRNVFVGNSKSFTISDPGTEMKIGVTLETVTDTFVTGLTKDYSSYITSDDDGYVVDYDNGKLTLVDKFDIGSQDDIKAALKSGKNKQVWNITNNFEIDKTVALGSTALYSVTINGNNHTISGKTGDKNLTHLLSVDVPENYSQDKKVVNINNLTLKSSNQFKNCIYVQDKVGKGKITLNNVTLDHTTANVGTGVPLLNNWCDITVTNNLSIITGTNSWHAINMDAKVGTSTLTFSEEEGKKASLTIIDNRTSTQKAKEPQIKLDNYYTVAAEDQGDYPQTNQTIVNGITAVGLVPIYASDKSTILGYSIPVITPQENTVSYTVVKTFTK